MNISNLSLCNFASQTNHPLSPFWEPVPCGSSIKKISSQCTGFSMSGCKFESWLITLLMWHNLFKQVRAVLGTTGPRDTTQRVLNLSILSLMLSAKKQRSATVCRASSLLTLWVVAQALAWVPSLSQRSVRSSLTESWTHSLLSRPPRYSSLFVYFSFKLVIITSFNSWMFELL